MIWIAFHISSATYFLRHRDGELVWPGGLLCEVLEVEVISTNEIT